jgi:AmmeMemoRadiSam system protein B
MRIRSPAVADLFYPGTSPELRATLERLLAGADETRATAPVKALIVPHAGYVYSGALAARAYARLGARAREIERVVLLGPCHRVWVEGLALPEADAFETPLGIVPVDAALRERVAALPRVTTSAAAHREEHSLEVQLPFLQAVLGPFTVLPLVVGGAGPETVAAVLDAVWDGPETLIVISSDLSHFHEEAVARRLDARTAQRIEQLDTALTGEDACGAAPVNGLLTLARRRGLRVDRVGLSDSTGGGGPASRVVGYGAWLLTETAA